MKYGPGRTRRDGNTPISRLSNRPSPSHRRYRNGTPVSVALKADGGRIMALFFICASFAEYRLDPYGLTPPNPTPVRAVWQRRLAALPLYKDRLPKTACVASGQCAFFDTA